MTFELPPVALITWNIAQPLKQPLTCPLGSHGPGPTIGIGMVWPARLASTIG